MQREPVVSSNIAAIGYDPDGETLEVEFSSGAAYSYSGVPKSVYDSFLASDSKGRFFAQNIKGVYSYQRAL